MMTIYVRGLNDHGVNIAEALGAVTSADKILHEARIGYKATMLRRQRRAAAKTELQNEGRKAQRASTEEEGLEDKMEEVKLSGHEGSRFHVMNVHHTPKHDDVYCTKPDDEIQKIGSDSTADFMIELLRCLRRKLEVIWENYVHGGVVNPNPRRKAILRAREELLIGKLYLQKPESDTSSDDNLSPGSMKRLFGSPNVEVDIDPEDITQ